MSPSVLGCELRETLQYISVRDRTETEKVEYNLEILVNTELTEMIAWSGIMMSEIRSSHPWANANLTTQ